MSEAEFLPKGRSEEDLAIEAFVDSIMEIHPDLDREGFSDTVSRCVREALPEDEEEESEGEEG